MAFIAVSTNPPRVRWRKHECVYRTSRLYAKHIEYTKSWYYNLYLTTVGLFDVYVVFSQWKSKQVFDYFTLGVEKVIFLVIVCFPWLQLLDISTEYA